MRMSHEKMPGTFFKLRFTMSAIPLFHTRPVILLKKETLTDL